MIGYEITKHDVFLGEIVIDPAGELIELAPAGCGPEKPVAGIGRRDQGKQFLDDGIGDSGPLSRRWNLRIQSRHLATLPPFIAMEEKCVVAYDRTTDGIAVNVSLERRNRRIRTVEKVLCIELLVAHELPSGTVQRIAALL